MAKAATYEIGKGIPLPPKGRPRNNRYPLGDMEIGDSFALVDSSEIERVRTAASYFGTRNPPKKFAVRRVDPITQAYRCWRIA